MNMKPPLPDCSFHVGASIDRRLCGKEAKYIIQIYSGESKTISETRPACGGHMLGHCCADTILSYVPIDGSAPKVHCLKIEKEYFRARLLGVKDWEYRNSDRCFEVGDELRLREIDWENGSKFTGRWEQVEILYILDTDEGNVILSTGKPVAFTDDARRAPKEG